MHDEHREILCPPQRGEGAQARPELCQNESLISVSEPDSRLSVALAQLKYHVNSQGFLYAARRLARLLALRSLGFLGLKKKVVGRAPEINIEDEELRLQRGEWVEVKSEEEILKTLDGGGERRGLSFTPEMREYCGRRFRVFKRVERICVEGKPDEMRRLKNTVILEGVICHGGSRACDRSCFLFWREAWLRRVDGQEPAPSADRLVQIKA
jgi:hypothetical protein